MGLGNTPANSMYAAAYNKAKKNANKRIRNLSRLNALVRQIALAAMKNKNNALYKKPVK